MEAKVLLSNLYVVLSNIASLAMAIAKNITKEDYYTLYFILQKTLSGKTSKT